MDNLHPGKLHFQRNVRGHLSSNFQVAWANSTNSAEGRWGATPTATVNAGRSTASTVLMTTWHRGDAGPETPDRGTQRTREERLTGIEDKKWQVNQIKLKQSVDLFYLERTFKNSRLQKVAHNWKVQVTVHSLALFYKAICKLKVTHKQGLYIKWKRCDQTLFLNIGQIILNLTRSQTKGAGKSHWLGTLLHFWGAIFKMKRLRNGPCKQWLTRATWRANEIFRPDISK